MKERKINTSHYSLLNPILITPLIPLGSLTAPHSQSCAADNSSGNRDRNRTRTRINRGRDRGRYLLLGSYMFPCA
ncbi:unnamed protein product [Tuber melanosporum]|uniref:(Perigord truffle) hypothetical protein n=1 Tax=Tuber melanosporum (strain Mel28) TaxID=656061 RepID=D5GL85_TUBMM|nr:uncharacterized protein GSTUM_00010057001 [Tuber melanosporum]CAZ85278.1 unnamed protein product [Tuber melanosporum]